jgi:hypothetical protein
MGVGQRQQREQQQQQQQQQDQKASRCEEEEPNVLHVEAELEAAAGAIEASEGIEKMGTASFR